MWKLLSILMLLCAANFLPLKSLTQTQKNVYKKVYTEISRLTEPMTTRGKRRLQSRFTQY